MKRTKHNIKSVSRSWIGIDNGPTGSIGVVQQSKTERSTAFFEVPSFTEQDYTKKKKDVSRIDSEKLFEILGEFPFSQITIERPMVNPMRVYASYSALRALEAVLITIARLSCLGLSYTFTDSKEWQKMLLPKGVEGGAALKKASMQIGIRMFPQHRELIETHGDADGLLLAEHMRRTQ